MKLTSKLFGFAILLLYTVHIIGVEAAEVNDTSGKIPLYFQKIGISPFDNNLPIYLDKRSIKRVSDNSYIYTTIVGIDSRKSEIDYIVNCNDISNVRLLRTRSYNNEEKISNIEQVDKLVDALLQRADNSDRYNANKMICN